MPFDFGLNDLISISHGVELRARETQLGFNWANVVDYKWTGSSWVVSFNGAIALSGSSALKSGIYPTSDSPPTYHCAYAWDPNAGQWVASPIILPSWSVIT